MSVGRAFHTAVSLKDERVLLIGGKDSNGVSRSVEIYDPKTGTWANAASLATPRMNHAAYLLPTGEVFVAGGQSDLAGNSALRSTEIFNPQTGAWRGGPDMAEARSCAASVGYSVGTSFRVLMAGGARRVSNQLSSSRTAEVYVADANVFIPVQQMSQDRFCGKAVVISQDRVLVTSGWTGLGSQAGTRPAGSEIFDLNTSSFSVVAQASARADASVDMVGGGAVIAGGRTAPTTADARVEAFDGANFTSIGSLTEARWDHRSAVLGTDALVIGGRDAAGAKASVEMVSAGRMVAMSPLAEARAAHSATVLANGMVLVCGGESSSGVVLSSVEMFAPSGATVPGATGTPGSGTTTPGATTAPDVQQLSPAQGSVGTLVTVIGRNFDATPSSNVVRFNGIAAPVTGGSATQLTVVVPNNASTGQVTVTSQGVTGAGQAFTVTNGSGNPIPSGPPPRILFVLPNSAGKFFPVSITGQDFGKRPVATFNGVPSISIIALSTKSLPFIGSVSELVTLVPPGATSGALVIDNQGLKSNPYNFTVK